MPPPLPPLTPIERMPLDYSALDEAMVHLECMVRHAGRALGVVAAGGNRVEAGRPKAGLERDAIID